MALTYVLAKASGFVSPSPQRSSTTSSNNSTTQAKLEQQSESGSMSPTKQRTEKWLREHSPRKQTSGSPMDVRKVKEGRIIKNRGPDQRKKRASFWFLPLWFSGTGQSERNDREEDDLEGDTMIDDDDGSAAAAGYDNDLTLVVDDDDGGVNGHKTAHPLQDCDDRYLNYDDPRIHDWTEEERWLFTKLTNRGHEPLLHVTWMMDYPTFPDQLFTNDESQVYINNAHGSIGRGTHYPSAYSSSRCS